MRPSKSRFRIPAVILAVLLPLVLVLPLVWPVPPLPNAVDPSELALVDSNFVRLSHDDTDSIDTHYLAEGDDACVVVFLHGFGASALSWREVLPGTAERCTAIAFDRPGFGLTERLMPGDWEGDNPYTLSAAADQTVALMDSLGIDRAVLVGHSAGGAVAVVAAARHPDRVRGLILEAPAIHGDDGGPPSWMRPLLTLPPARRVGPLFLRRALAGDAGVDFVRGAWADPSAVSEETIEAYRLPLRVRDWDRALWEFTIAPRTDDPAALLGDITAPVLVIAGEQDTYVPFEDSVRVANELGTARLVSWEDAGHIPHEEFPERFVNEVWRFLDDLAEAGAP